MKILQATRVGQQSAARSMSIVFAACLVTLSGCDSSPADGSAGVPATGGQGTVATDSGREANGTVAGETTGTGESGSATSGGTVTTGDSVAGNNENYCAQFTAQADVYFCEDFAGTSPMAMVGLIPPMSFRDQTFREYTPGELFELADPDVGAGAVADTDAEALTNNVLDLHDDLVDGSDFSSYAAATRAVSKNWDITAHSRDGYVEPGTGSGFNDAFWWNQNALMGEHGNRCSPPPDLNQYAASSVDGERAYSFMQQFFNLPSTYNGDENSLAQYWLPDFEGPLLDSAGIHHILRYEDMVYVCADHLMTAAYAEGAAKVSITPDHLLDLSSGTGIVEFSVSTYRTAGRDYWQIDLTPLSTHLQLPEGDVVADANGKAVNGFNINTELDDGLNGPVDLLGGINVFRTMMVKDGRFLDNGVPIAADDPAAVYTRAQFANPGNAERLQLYQQAPDNKDWVITHTSYNEVMADYLRSIGESDVTLHNVTDNRSRARFRLTVLKTPVDEAWAANADLWDQVSLCMPDYGNRCVGEYIVPELDDELLVQFTHYAYNTTKSCDNAGQPHGIFGAAFQSTCHPNTYHWDNFYISPARPFTVTRAIERTAMADSRGSETIAIEFEEAAPPNSKLRFNALTGGDDNGHTTLEVSFDDGVTWSVPNRQYEPENSFEKFRSYYTGANGSAYIPVGVKRVLFRADNAAWRDAFWIRDASFWSFDR